MVSFAEGTVFALVRKDKTTPNGRIVALARSADEVMRKVCPPATEAPAEKAASTGSPWRKPAASAAQSTQAKQRAAAAEMQSELAEYRRACAAAGVTAPKLV